jgi:hypothetical protein
MIADLAMSLALDFTLGLAFLVFGLLLATALGFFDFVGIALPPCWRQLMAQSYHAFPSN